MSESINQFSDFVTVIFEYIYTPICEAAHNMMQALGTTITYLWHQAFSEAIERLNSLSTDDYYTAIAQYGHSIKRTIIYVNYIISLIIIVPYLLLVGCDFVIYIFRVLGDVLHSNVESAKVRLRQKASQKVKVQ